MSKHPDTGGAAEMRTAQLMKLVKKYIQPHFTGFCIKRSLLYAVPVDWVLRGFDFQPSWLDPEAFTVNVFAQPLYVPRDHIVLGYGERLGWLKYREDIWWLWSPDRPDEEAPTFGAVCALMQEVGLPFLARLQTPADFVRQVGRLVWSRDDAYGQETIAYSLILTGDYKKAQKALTRLYRDLRRDEPTYPWMGPMAERAERLLQLLSTDPSLAVHQLRLWRDETVKNLRLEERCRGAGGGM